MNKWLDRKCGWWMVAGVVAVLCLGSGAAEAGTIGGTGTARSWQAVGQALVPGQAYAKGAQNTIYGLGMSTSRVLYAAGAFTNIGGSNCYRIARYDGTNWSDIGGGIRQFANANCVAASSNGIVYAGGYFTNIGGVNSRAVAKWNGTAWEAMGDGAADSEKGLYFSKFVNGYVNSIVAASNGAVYAGGYFTNSNYRYPVAYASKWTGTAWTNMQDGFRNVVNCMAEGKDGTIYAGGSFTNWAGAISNKFNVAYVAKWNGTAWTNVGLGLGNRLTCMTVAPDGTLYVGGWFTNAASMVSGVISPARYVAKWDSARQVWTNVGSGFNNWVYALTTGPDGTLYAGGAFTNTWDSDVCDTNAPQVKANRIARWDGSRWQPIGGGVNDSVISLATDPVDGTLYVGGFFKLATQPDGSTTSTWYVAKWAVGGVSGGVTPSNGPAAGGFEVVIDGSNLCNGTTGDLTRVTLCGATATVVSVQGSTQIVVTAAGALSAGMGHVVVVSESLGQSVASNAFEYVMSDQAPLTFSPATPLTYGTTIGLSAGGGSGTGALTFEVLDGPGSISEGTNLTATSSSGNISVRAAKAGDAWYLPTAVTAIVATAKADQTIDFPAIGNQVATNRVGLTATASSGISPWFVLESGPAVLSDGTNLTFTGAGTVKVLARETGNAWFNAAPDVTNEFSVSKAEATVTLHSLEQTYDGTPRVVTATTVPTGVTVRITYNGVTNAPINQGHYAVTGTVDNVLWQGSATGTLAVAGLTQTITFAPIAPQKTTASVGLRATGGASGNPVTFAVVSGPGSIAGATNLTFTGAGDVAVVASQAGNVNYGAAPDVTNVVKVFSVSPDNGPFAGGNAVTVSNGNFGTVTNVQVGSAGALPASSGANWFTLAMPAAAQTGRVDVVVQSVEQGNVVLAGAYTYNPVGSIGVVSPSSGMETGGFEVVISGSNFGDGADITNVTLCGAAAAIQSQSATQVVVVAGAGTPGLGDVGVFSTHYGLTVKSNAFEYLVLGPPEMIVLGTNGAVIASGDAAQAANGTAFSLLRPGQNEARVFSVSNGGVARLEIAGWGSSDARFAVEGMPSSLAAGAASNFTVRFSPDAAGAFASAILFSNNAEEATFTLNVAGGAWAVTPDNGPLAGGNSVTVIAGGIGAGADIHSATIGGVEGTITAQTATSVTFTAGANVTNGLKDIVIRSANTGATTLANAYTVNPAGLIEGGGGGQVWMDYRVNFFGGTSSDPNENVRYPTNTAADGQSRWTYFDRSLTGTPLQLMSTNGVTNGVYVDLSAYGSDFGADGIRYASVDWIAQQPATNFIYSLNNASNYVRITNLPGSSYQVDFIGAYYGGGSSWKFNTKLMQGVWNVSDGVAGGSWGTNASPTWQNPGGGGNNMDTTNASWFADRYVTWSDVAPSNKALTLVQWPGTGATYNNYVFLNAMRIRGWEPTGEEGGAGVDPAFGALAGGYAVTILGTNLCDGTTGDVRVWLAGEEAAVQSVSGSTQIVVTAGTAAYAGMGDVVVESVRFGASVSEDAFTYRHAASFRVIGLDGAEIADNETPLRSKGTDFGEAGTGMAVTNIFTIENPGSNSLAITGWTTNGTGAASFRVVSAPASVSAGGRGYLTVAFQPSGAGTQSAQIGFANDSGMTPYRLNVAGKGLAGSLRIDGDGAFGAVQTDGTMARTFMLRNVGGVLLNINQTDLSDAVNYSHVGIPATLAAGASAEFTVSFEPQSDGAKAATLTVGTAEGSSYVLALLGEGFSQTLLAVRGTNGADLASGAAASVAAGTDFGFAARSAPVARTFTIANGGNQTLHVWGITLEGAGAGKFSLSGVPATVAGGAEATFTATFLDNGPGGAFEAEIRVATDVEPSPFTLNVRALGQEDGMTFATDPVTNATVGAVYRYEPRAVDLAAPGLAVAYTASNLPAWLTFSPGGGDAIISTLAGRSVAQVVGGQTVYTSGFSGDGGPATNADLSSPAAVAVDRLGNVFVADAGNYRIRRIAAADGKVETIAGNGTNAVTGDDGVATAAGLGEVRQIALGPNGDLYFSTDRTIRRVDSAGMIRRVAGSGLLGFSGVGGSATNAALNLFAGLRVDAATNVYFTAQGAEPYICRVDAAGILHVAATATTLAASANLAVDSQGRVHYAEAGRIVRIEAGGGLTAVATGTALTLSGLAMGGDDTLYYAQNSRVFAVDAALNPAEVVAGTGANGFSGDGGTATNASLGGAALGLSVADDGRVFLADSYVNRVRAITPDWPGLSGTPAVGDAGTSATVAVNAANSRTNVAQVFEIAVAGKPEPGYLNVSNNAGFGGGGSRYSLAYPTVELGSQQALTLAITNSGSAAMRVTEVTVDGSSSFQISNVPSLLPAGSASNVWVVFRPSSVGLHGAVIEVAHNGPDSPLVLSVGGSSVLPGEMGVDKAALTYAATYGGTNPAMQTIVLTNKGGVAYVFTNAVVGGSWFAFAPAGGTVNPFSGLVVTGSVAIAGLDAGTHTLTSRLSSATASNSPVDVLVQLTLAKASQSITYTPLGNQVVTAEIGLEATSTSGLAVEFVVTDGPAQIAGGTNLTFQNEGNVTLEVRQSGNVNYNPAPTLTNQFNVTKTPLTITITNAANKTYDGLPAEGIGVETVPAGVDCSITFNGATNLPLNVGTYAILANSADWRYVGTATATLQITKATAAIGLSDTNHVYDGTAKAATAATTPTNLATELRYEGSLSAPTNAGDYEVTVSVVDANYAGSLTGQLSIAKADQAITFGAISVTPVSWKSTHGLTPTSTSGRVVALSVTSGPGSLTAGTSPATLSFTNVGTVVVVASEGGNANWNPAASVTQEVDAVSSEPIVLGTNGAVLASGEAVSEAKGTDGGIVFVNVGVQRTFVITNAGDEVLVVASATLSGDGKDAFTFDEISDPIDPGEAYPFTVTMKPLAVGVHTATVALAHNAPMDDGEFRLNLSVEGFDPRMAVFGGGEPVESGSAASVTNGTDFGYWPVGMVLTNVFTITNAGANELEIDGWGLDGAAFSVSGIPSTVASLGADEFEIAFEVSGLVRRAGVLTMTNNAAAGAYELNLVGGGYAIVPGNGPLAGGNAVAVSGEFGTVTGIVVGGTAAMPGSTNAGGFTLTMPAGLVAGPVDLVVQSAEYGAIVLEDAYAYNPAGAIDAVTPSSGSWTGGVEVVISGSNFGDGADVTNVTLVGLTATIQSQSATQVVVKAAQSLAGATSGAVRVFSTSFGETAKLNAFGYSREDQAITFPAFGAKTYGDAPFALGATSSVPALAVSFVHSNPNVATNDASGTLYIVGAGTNEIVATQAGDAFYNAAPSLTNVLVVTQKVLTVTNLVVSNKVYDATDVASFGGAELVGVVGGDNVSLANAAVGAFAQATTGTAIAVSHTMSLSGPSAVQYLLVPPTGLSADITARTVTATNAVAQNKAYDGTTAATVQNAELAGAVPGDDVALANAATGTFAQAEAGTNLAVTTYMSLSGTDAPNYAFTTPTLYADITKAAQEIEFDAISDQFWTNEVALTATASSGLAVEFEVVEGPATIVGSNLTMTGYGYVSVRAKQSGNENWAAAEDQSEAFNALGPEFLPLGTNGDAIVAGNVPDVADGTGFPATLVGLEARTNVFELYNPGNAALTMASVVTNGAQAGSYILRLATNEIAAYGSTTFEVEFEPQVGGSNVAEFVFTFDGTNSPYTVNVSGLGIGGGIALETNALSFAATYVGTNPAAQTVAMTNVGVSGFTYTNVITYGAGASGWLAAVPASGTLALGGAVTLTNLVDITGLNAGTHSATVAVTAADATNSPQTYVVSLTVARAAQGITFPAIADQLTTNITMISATSTSGLPVMLTVMSGPATLSAHAAGRRAPDGTASPADARYSASGTVAIRAMQVGNSNWLAAATLTNTYEVFKTPQAALTFAPATPQTFGTTNVLSTTGGSGSGVVSYAVSAGMGEIVGTNALHATTGTGDVTVVATKATDAMYLATAATATVAYAKADQTISFPAIGDQLTTNELELAATATSGMTVLFAVESGPASITDFTNLTFSTSGTVSIVASEAGDSRYNPAPSVTNTFAVTKALATVTLSNLTQTYDGTPRVPTVLTGPTGLTVVLTYDGVTNAPINAGSYAVTGTVVEAMWQGSSTGLLVVGKATAQVTLTNLYHVGDGIPKHAQAITVPAGLTVDFTYDGSATAPTNPSVYAVTGTVNEANYQGETNGFLTIVHAPASLGDTVWLDENWDGVQNTGESGIPNVRMELLTNGTLVSETRTDTAGLYLFADLLPGEYTVRVDTNTLEGSLSENLTHDPDGTTNHQSTVTLNAGDSIRTLDFGYNWSLTNSVQGAIGDRVWVDANRNGVQDSGEPGIPNVNLSLYIDADANGAYTTQFATATTDAAGQYIFPALNAWAYVVRVDTNTLPVGYAQTGDPDYFGAVLPVDRRDHQTTAPVLLAPGGVFVNADFGYAFAQGSSIGGLIYLDLDASGAWDAGKPGLLGVTVTLLDAASNAVAHALTDDDGAYRFTGLASGTYTVWVSDSGNVLNRRIQTGGPGGLLNRRSTVVADGSSAYHDQDFGFAPERQAPGLGLIGNTIFLDREGNGGAPLQGEGIQNVTVDLMDSTGTNRVATTTTDEDGRYYFGGLEAATYEVVVLTNTLPFGAAAWSNTVHPASPVVLGAGEINLDQNFGYVGVSGNAIEGILWRDNNANGLIDADEPDRFENVRVLLRMTNGTVMSFTFTDADGVYRFTGLPDGVYGIEVLDVNNVMYGYLSSPVANPTRRKGIGAAANIFVTGGMAYTTGNVGFYLPYAELGNTVWYDINGNGLQDGGEPGLAGVQVSLTIEYPDGEVPVDMQTQTSSNGQYRFSNLLLDPRYDEATTNDPVTARLPRFMVWMDTNQTILTAGAYKPTLIDAGGGTNDSRNPAGVFAAPLRKGGFPINYDFGYSGGPLLAVIGNVEAFTRDGQTIVRWETVESFGTAGFWLERKVGESWVRISPELLPFPLFGVTPIVYEEADPTAVAGGTYVYRLVELENDGDELTYGPYTLTVDGPGRTYDDWAAEHSVGGRDEDDDGDGLTNGQEFLAWTDPTRADSVLELTALREIADGLELSWQSVPGRTYKIAVATSMNGPFLPLAQGFLATEETSLLTFPADPQDRQLFFQVILVGE